jgi:CheY-like chemotaxis protein
MYYERTGSPAVVQVEDTNAAGRILVVDDDPAFAAFAVMSLEARGHDVDSASTAADALASLYAARYDLVLIDLQLPDSNGLQLLRGATDDGLLIGSSAVILTGHDFEEPSDIRVMRKPLDRDLDPFLDRIGQIVAITKRRRATSGRSIPAPAGNGSASHDTRRRTRIELVLYTSASSEKSQRALKTVRNVLRLYESESVHFTVCDLANDPEAGDEDAVVFTPTLVKRGPGARTYIVGNLDEPTLVSDLLDVSGVKRLKE